MLQAGAKGVNWVNRNPANPHAMSPLGYSARTFFVSPFTFTVTSRGVGDEIL